MTTAAVLATEQMHDLSGEIVSLRLTMTSSAERVDMLTQAKADHETRIRALEARR